MGMDVNDIKIQMKTCHQWVKDHPLVSGVLLFFYLLYIFLPSIFAILFYSFPLVICSAILLSGSHIRQENHAYNIKKDEDKPTTQNVKQSVVHGPQHAQLQTQMSRRTFGKDKSREKDKDDENGGDIPKNDDPIMNIKSVLEEEIMPMKDSSTCAQEKNDDQEESSDSVQVRSKVIKTYAALPLTSIETVSENPISEKTPCLSRAASTSSLTSDDDEPQEETQKVVAWTEDDQRNLMDLGSSEIERNNRLESLMEKRKARKLLSMQPRRNHYDYLGSYYPRDQYIDRVGPLMLVRPRSSRNPFDLPYDPHEERPILRGGSFEEEFFVNLLKDFPFGHHEGYNFARSNPYGQQHKDDSDEKSLPCSIPQPAPLDKAGHSRFKRESDVEDNAKEEVLGEAKQEEHSATRENEGDHASVNKGRDDSGESSSSSSSSSSASSTRSRISKTSSSHSSYSSHESRRSTRKKTKPARNSTKKGLTCLTAPRNKDSPTRKGKSDASSSNLLDPSSSTGSNSTKKGDRYYSSRTRHHKHTCSIASDLQVELSESGSPSLGALDPGSPPDQESLVYDGDVDRDANSGDEDFWGASPHPMRAGSFGARAKLPDIAEVSHNIEPVVVTDQMMREGITPVLSVIPEKNVKEVVDQKSTNVEIIESRTLVSNSSSSESLDSQKKGKSQHLAEYLACLHPRETESGTLEFPGTPHVREGSVEEITIQEESKRIFEMDEDKEDSKESQRNREPNHARGQSELSKGSRSASNECIEGGVARVIADEYKHSRRSEDDKSVHIEDGVTEVKPKELNFDSFSTTSEDDIGDQKRSRNHTESEVKAKSPDIIHQESTSMEKATSQSGNVVHDEKKSGFDEETIKRLPKIEDVSQPVKTEEATTTLDNNGDQTRSGEKLQDKSGNELKTTSGNQTENEVKAKSPDINHKDSTSVKKATGLSDNVVNSGNKLGVDEETSNMSQKIEDAPQLVKTEEANTTTTRDNNSDQTRSREEHHNKSGTELKSTSGNQTESEVKPESPNIIPHERTSLEKAKGEPGNGPRDSTKSAVDEETNRRLPKIEDVPQTVKTEEATTSLDKNGDQTRSVEEHHAESENALKTTSNVTHEESTSQVKATGEASHAVHDANKLNVDEKTTKESKVISSPKMQDKHQPVKTEEEANKELPTSTNKLNVDEKTIEESKVSPPKMQELPQPVKTEETSNKELQSSTNKLNVDENTSKMNQSQLAKNAR